MPDIIDNKDRESARDEAASRSIRPVIEHALAVYYDGNAELARTLVDRLLDENRPQPPGGHRYRVRELGPRSFVVHDNVSQLDCDMTSTGRAAQADADRRNEAVRADLDATDGRP
ncbi:hypothetical protein ABZ953_06850 [Streptomyces sp. NPDC046465]|uniref:hypothetical protein n=1 Tax=Streptomyces sp. NPDC046465 TaxID=3155810 RepID=UPI0033DB4DF6